MVVEILKSIVFGIVEGITEWLPISSTGHLILLNSFMRLTENEEFWSVYKYVIQLGAILAVIVLYFDKLNPWSRKKDEAEKKHTWNLWLKIIIASIPTGITGVLLNDFADEHLSSPAVVAIMLIVYGILFILIERRPKKVTVRSVQQIGPKKAFWIGVAQSLAVIPGTSRSGSTIIGSLLLGLNRSTAAEFSFFLAIPVMFGVSLLEIIKHHAAIAGGEVIVLLAGMIVSFLVSCVVIRSLMHYVRKHDFTTFGYYRIILGTLILVLSLAGVLSGAAA